MIVDYQRDFLKDVEISLGKRTANSLFTKNGFCLFQCFPFVFDNNEIRYTLRDRLEMVPARSHKPFYGGPSPPPASFKKAYSNLY